MCDSEKSLTLGKMERKRKRGQQRMTLINGIKEAMNLSLERIREPVQKRKEWHNGSQRIEND